MARDSAPIPARVTKVTTIRVVATSNNAHSTINSSSSTMAVVPPADTRDTIAEAEVATKAKISNLITTSSEDLTTAIRSLPVSIIQDSSSSRMEAHPPTVAAVATKVVEAPEVVKLLTALPKR